MGNINIFEKPIHCQSCNSDYKLGEFPSMVKLSTEKKQITQAPLCLNEKCKSDSLTVNIKIGGPQERSFFLPLETLYECDPKLSCLTKKEFVGKHLPNPLSVMEPPHVVKSFQDEAYAKMTPRPGSWILLSRHTSEHTQAGGGFWHFDHFATSETLRDKLAIVTEFKNNLNCANRILVPHGIFIYVGKAKPQGSLPGGGKQVYIPPSVAQELLTATQSTFNYFQQQAKTCWIQKQALSFYQQAIQSQKSYRVSYRSNSKLVIAQGEFYASLKSMERLKMKINMSNSAQAETKLQKSMLKEIEKAFELSRSPLLEGDKKISLAVDTLRVKKELIKSRLFELVCKEEQEKMRLETHIKYLEKKSSTERVENYVPNGNKFRYLPSAIKQLLSGGANGKEVHGAGSGPNLGGKYLLHEIKDGDGIDQLHAILTFSHMETKTSGNHTTYIYYYLLKLVWSRK